MNSTVSRRDFLLRSGQAIIGATLMHSSATLGRSTFTPVKGLFEFEHVVVEAKDVASTMNTIRTTRSGIVPVVLGEAKEMKQFAQLIHNNGPFEKVLKKGLAINLDRWMRDRRARDPEYYKSDGKARKATPATSLMYVADKVHSGGEIVIGLVPAKPAWKVAAHVRFGGWNDCPYPEEQLAFFKRWHERYGAVVTTIAGDVVEFNVSRPPQGADAALILANEHFVYCPDSVHQGAGNLNTLAASLDSNPHWYFWWD